LSGQKGGERDGSGNPRRSSRSPHSDKKGKKQRSTDLGRALRSVYDDTLRESVPDEFIDLLGKLS
jgi:hypothetical protein